MYKLNAEIIKKLRKIKGLSQSEFAKELNSSRSLIAKIELGEQDVTDKFSSKILFKFKDDIELHNLHSIKSGIESDDMINNSEEFFNINKNWIQFSNLEIVLSDNMKILYFIANILSANNYQFSRKEKKDLKFYEGLENLFDRVRTGEEIIKKNEFELLDRIIKSSLFSFINSLMFEAEKILNIEIIYNMDEIIK